MRRPPQPPGPLADDASGSAPAPADAAIEDAPARAELVAEVRPVVMATTPEVWLKGSTHVHARPSGDSSTPIADVVVWYEQRGYDFIVLTDHNRVSEVGPVGEHRRAGHACAPRPRA